MECCTVCFYDILVGTLETYQKKTNFLIKNVPYLWHRRNSHTENILTFRQRYVQKDLIYLINRNVKRFLNDIGNYKLN